LLDAATPTGAVVGVRPTAVSHRQQLSGEPKLMAAIPEQLIIEKILSYLELGRPRATARGQPQQAE
jgi:hypothetical protein